MAVSCNLLQLPITIKPNFHSSQSIILPRPFNLPLTSHHNFPSPSAAASTNPLTAVVNPALANANILFFTSGYNVQILVEENEPEEALLRRFRREVSKAGIIPECKRRRFFENFQEEKKRKTREAARRNRRRSVLLRNDLTLYGDKIFDVFISNV